MIPQGVTDSELARSANVILDSAGLHDCRVAVGYYRNGNQIVHEARLIGGSDASREKAKSLLPHITFAE